MPERVFLCFMLVNMIPDGWENPTITYPFILMGKEKQCTGKYLAQGHKYHGQDRFEPTF